MISAVLFDFDGIIVDSERLHFKAFSAVLEPLGKSFTWPEYIETFIGFDDRDTFRTVFPNLGNPPRPSLHSGHPSAGGDGVKSPPAEGCPQGGEGLSLDELITKKAAAFQALLESDGAAALPGAVELIQNLSGNIPLAICSGALLEDILPILEKLGIENAFDTIVTADDTHISKPDPAPYRLAAEQISQHGHTPSRIRDSSEEREAELSHGNDRREWQRRPTSNSVLLAIEDTPAGIASAKGAGLKVLAVTNSYAREFLIEADAIVDSLEGLSPEKLTELISAG